MKKRLTLILLVLVALAPLAAQGTEVQSPFALGDFFSEAPMLSFGLEGAYEGVLMSNRITGLSDAFLTTVINPGAVDGVAFWGRPWLDVTWSALTLGTALHFDQGQLAGELPMLGLDNTFWNDDLVIETSFHFEVEGLELHETIYVEPTTQEAYEHFYGEMAVGNFAAGFGWFAEYDPTTPLFFSNGSFAGHEIADAWFSANDVFGLADVKIGGVDARYFRMQSLFFEPEPVEFFSELFAFIPKPVFASQSRDIGLLQVFALGNTGGGTPIIMDPNATAISSTMGFGALTIYSGASVPFDATQNFQNWLRFNNLKLGASYLVEGLGTFDAGWDVGLGYKRDSYFDGANYFKDYKFIGDNRFWLDADLDLAETLDLRAGFDLSLSSFNKVDAVTGAGTTVDPSVRDYGMFWVANLGVEARMELANLLAGLSAEGGAYLSFWGGKTFDEVYAGAQTFDAYINTAFPTATYFHMSSLSEGAYLNDNAEYDGTVPLAVYLAANWALNERWAFRFADQFAMNAAYLDGTYYAAAPLQPVGYYSLDVLEIGARYVEGPATFMLDFGWQFALGLPSADDLTLTDAIAQGVGYDSAKELMQNQGPFGPTEGLPWILKAGVKVQF